MPRLTPRWYQAECVDAVIDAIQTAANVHPLAAVVTGGTVSALGNGVRVEIDGLRQGQTVVAGKLRIRNVPGTGGPARFTLIGAVGGYRSAADFRVQGQPVDASAGSVVFLNGQAGGLGNGRRVRVTGTAVREGGDVAERRCAAVAHRALLQARVHRQTGTFNDCPGLRCWWLRPFICATSCTEVHPSLLAMLVSVSPRRTT